LNLQLRPRDLDIPDIFKRFYACTEASVMQQWCLDFISEKIELRLTPFRPDFLESQSRRNATDFFCSHVGCWKCEGIANSGDLLIGYGKYLTTEGEKLRFSHVWWLSGKCVISFEEFVCPAV